MKKTLFALIFFSPSLCFSLEEVSISTGEWPPYTSQTLVGYGSASKTVTSAFAAVGISVSYKWAPWKRAYLLAKEGLVDATIPWYKTKERQQDFYYSTPVSSSRTMIWYSKKNPVAFEKLADLKGLSVGVSIGYSYGEEFDAAKREGKLFEVKKGKTDTINLKKLLLGRIDVFPCSMRVCSKLIKEYFNKREADLLTYAATPLEVRHTYLLVSKKHKHADEIISEFNKGMKLIGK